MLWWVIGLFLALATMLGSLSSDLLSRAQDNRDYLKSVAQRDLSQAMVQYRRERGTFPASGPALALEPGFSSLRTWLSTANGGLQPLGTRDYAEIAVSPALTDTQWRYDRAVAFSMNDMTVPAVTYLGATQNDCAPAAGPADFATAQAWCGNKQSRWTRMESREAYIDELESGRAAQIRTMSKFLAFYNDGQVFPNPGSEVNLSALAGGPAVAENCSGIYVWQGIPLGCEDLFSRWGTPTTYIYANSRKIALVAASRVFDNTGAPVVVSTEVEL
jgi:hypothetical protein